MLVEDVASGLVGVFDDSADLVIDLAGDLIRVVRFRTHVAAEERLAPIMAEYPGTEPLRHAETHHHLLRSLGDLFEVVRGAGGDLIEYEFLGSPAAQGHGHRLGELGTGGQELVLRRKGDRVAKRLATTDHGDLVDGVTVGKHVADDRVTHLVVGRDLALLLGKDPGLLLRSGDHPHDPLLELVLGDLGLARTGTEKSGLVDQVREIGPGKAWCLAGKGVEVDVAGERLASRVNFENLLAALPVGPVDGNLAIESAGPEQRRVEDVGPVGRGDKDDVVLDLEAVHLDQQLVEGLLPFIVAATHPGAAVTAHGVDLVHEDDAG